MERSELFKTVSAGKSASIKLYLCFYNPEEVYRALTTNQQVKKWLDFISNHYKPPKKKVLLIYPCSRQKPYYKSQSYRQLFKTLSALRNDRDDVHLMTISEPFGLVPEEFFGKKTEWHDWKSGWYDCPGLFKWWCHKYGQPYSYEYLGKCVDQLAMCVGKFLNKAQRGRSYRRIIAFVRTYSSGLKRRQDHTHRRIIERAAAIAKVKVDILPTRDLVSNIVASSGRYAWDRYGVAHPIAQQFLLKHLRGVTNED